MSNDITIERKWVLFDTCTISKILVAENRDHIISSVVNKIGSFTPTITSLIRLEFLRQANSKKEFEEFREYLSSNYTEINLTSGSDRIDIYNLSSELACIIRYASHQHYKHIESVDIIHGGLLRRYPQNLYLLTFDKNDFPDPIFEIVFHESIKIGKQLEIFAIFRFNKIGFSELYNNFKNNNKSKFSIV